MIKREKYLQKIVPFIDKPLIKVLIGVRRSGKTVLLSQIRGYIQSTTGVEDERLVDMNFESFTNSKYLNAVALYDFVLQKSKAVSGKRLYLFFDEIQEVEEWQKVINSLSVDIDCDIYITGSNSNLLSGELATYIAGRYVHFTVYPFTFAEYMQFKGSVAADREAYFDDYLRFGGLPQRFILDDEQSVRTYLDDVFNTIVIKDIIARNKITDVDLLRRLISFLLENVGNPFSANTICKRLSNEGVKTTVPTLMNYIAAIKNAMVVQVAPRYDIKGKALLSTNEKYYATDLGLRNNIKSSDIVDYNKLYENVVFIEMLSRGYEINVGKEGDYEVDFICIKGRNKVYVQVAYLLADNAVIEREFCPLMAIEDNFPKYVVSGDRHDFSNNGIIHKNIIDFLLSSDL